MSYQSNKAAQRKYESARKQVDHMLNDLAKAAGNTWEHAFSKSMCSQYGLSGIPTQRQMNCIIKINGRTY